MGLFSIIFLLLSAFGINSLHAASSLSKMSSEGAWRVNYLHKIGIIPPSAKKTLVDTSTRSRAQAETMLDQKVKKQLPPKATNLDNMLILKALQPKSVPKECVNRLISNHEELELCRPRGVSIDHVFLFAQADCAKREANFRTFHKDSSAGFMSQIGYLSSETNWTKLLNGSPDLATGFMEQVDSEIGQVNWAEFLGILPEELGFCLQRSYQSEVDVETKISLFWLFCYGYNIFPSLKKAILSADNVVEEASDQESLAQSLATFLAIHDAAQFSSKKKIRLCEFIEEFSRKIEQLMTQRHAAKIVESALKEFRVFAWIEPPKNSFAAGLFPSAEEDSVFPLDS